MPRSACSAASFCRLGGRLTRSLHKGPLELAAVRAAGGVFFGAGLGRWALSTISHCVWLAYLAGCLVVVVLLLSTRQYDFAWETTILSEPVYVRMARLIALPVQALGFAVPDAGADRRQPLDRRGARSSPRHAKPGAAC